ncbi:MAG: hypothetical protein PHG62_07135, partial [Proteiniphilum sp.]|nr:hypothetical protein [Proteiniphilum sp.]
MMRSTSAMAETDRYTFRLLSTLFRRHVKAILLLLLFASNTPLHLQAAHNGTFHQTNLFSMETLADT